MTPQRSGDTIPAPVKLAPAAAALILIACAPDPAPPLAKTLSSHSAAIGHAPPPALTLESFRAFAETRREEVARCYEAALAGEPALHGRLQLAFPVLPTGAIGAVEVASSTFAGDAVPACVRGAVTRWRTPFRPDEPVGIEYPLVFSPAPAP